MRFRRSCSGYSRATLGWNREEEGLSAADDLSDRATIAADDQRARDWSAGNDANRRIADHAHCKLQH